MLMLLKVVPSCYPRICVSNATLMLRLLPWCIPTMHVYAFPILRNHPTPISFHLKSSHVLYTSNKINF